MNNRLEYPIKYAVLKLKREGGWNDNYEDVTVGYIASKCYLVESSIKYRRDGSNAIMHSVVFPYSDFTRFYFQDNPNISSLPIEEEPRYDALDYPYPIRIVDKLFDNYEEAKKEAEIQNLKLKHDCISKLYLGIGKNWNDLIRDFEKKFEDDMKKCNLYEEMITKSTKKDKVTKSSKIFTLEPIK